MEMCRNYVIPANGWPITFYRNPIESVDGVLLPGVELSTNFPLLSSTRIGKLLEIYSLSNPISTAVKIAVDQFNRSPVGCLGCSAGVMAGNGDCRGVEVEQCVLANRKKHMNGAGEIVDVIYGWQGSRKIKDGGKYPFQPNCLSLPKRIIDPLT